MRLWEELQKPFNLLSTAIAVVSLAASVYFYYASLQRREPVYLIQKSSQIVSSTVSSPNFRVVDEKGNPISGDIHLLEIVFWNAGRLPIEPSDVRNPVVITFPTKHKLLETRLVRQTKATVSEFVLAPLPTDTALGPRIQISWKHLDPGLGARLQFIYVGEPNPPLKFEGDILDATIESAEPALRGKFGGLISMVTLFVTGLGSVLLLGRLLEGPIQRSRTVLGLLLIFLKWGIALGLAGFINWALFAVRVAPA